MSLVIPEQPMSDKAGVLLNGTLDKYFSKSTTDVARESTLAEKRADRRRSIENMKNGSILLPTSPVIGLIDIVTETTSGELINLLDSDPLELKVAVLTPNVSTSLELTRPTVSSKDISECTPKEDNLLLVTTSRSRAAKQIPQEKRYGPPPIKKQRRRRDLLQPKLSCRDFGKKAITAPKVSHNSNVESEGSTIPPLSLSQPNPHLVQEHSMDTNDVANVSIVNKGSVTLLDIESLIKSYSASIIERLMEVESRLCKIEHVLGCKDVVIDPGRNNVGKKHQNITTKPTSTPAHVSTHTPNSTTIPSTTAPSVKPMGKTVTALVHHHSPPKPSQTKIVDQPAISVINKTIDNTSNKTLLRKPVREVGETRHTWGKPRRTPLPELPPEAVPYVVILTGVPVLGPNKREGFAQLKNKIMHWLSIYRPIANHINGDIAHVRRLEWLGGKPKDIEGDIVVVNFRDPNAVQYILNWQLGASNNTIIPKPLTYFYPRSLVFSSQYHPPQHCPPQRIQHLQQNNYPSVQDAASIHHVLHSSSLQNINNTYQAPHPVETLDPRVWNYVMPKIHNPQNGSMDHLQPFTPLETFNRFDIFSGLEDCD